MKKIIMLASICLLMNSCTKGENKVVYEDNDIKIKKYNVEGRVVYIAEKNDSIITTSTTNGKDTYSVIKQ